MRLTMLRRLYERPGPWASVYLDTSRDTADAARLIEQRWHAAREILAEAGCDPLTVHALEDAVLDHPARPGRHGLALFATAGEVILRQALHAPPATTISAYEPLPDAMPMVAQLAGEIHYLRVAVAPSGTAIDAAATGRLIPGGGWSPPLTDLTWRAGAGDPADAVTELADRTGPELILVAGAPQARPRLVTQLPDRWRERVVETENAVPVQAMTDCAEALRRDTLARLHAQLAHDGSAGNGLSEVVSYLSRGQVDTLLMIDDPSSTERLWIGPDPHQLSDDPEELRSAGAAHPPLVRADAAMLRALAATDASILLCDPDEHDLRGGVAALLRYADARR
ncbi:hypothetical protein ACWT_8052 [Actinoplanes sp. SE50]|uniref:baeRF2 domain-containing protein n=1 Tax=unclassified Actinoplanes TaxID=2626549 RepID=UPI00023EE0E5|nr:MULTISPECIES: hypothetical protein [unclassified Actinoplanes]AEV89061.1 hypothetical protein ACPL_8183 [Actinoplanes sp. SE50/110]ATO87467.1 hypothetical protein ACWT_8052 [Actinoplanes sp. SE50]SLM04885.1 hypothetical protein ACSP50_8197 [Actinoplanes sp. SE50/110]